MIMDCSNCNTYVKNLSASHLFYHLYLILALHNNIYKLLWILHVFLYSFTCVYIRVYHVCVHTQHTVFEKFECTILTKNIILLMQVGGNKKIEDTTWSIYHVVKNGTWTHPNPLLDTIDILFSFIICSK